MSEQDGSEVDALEAPRQALRLSVNARCPFAEWHGSPNFTRGRSSAVDRLVIHITDGQPLLYRAIEHLCKPSSRVSAHFLVGQAGEVMQLVELDDTAWHARGMNGRSVGIEHIARTPGELGPDDPGLPLTAPQLAASARLLRWLSSQLQLPLDAQHVIPHHLVEGTTHRDCGRSILDGGIWPWEQYWESLRNG